MIAYKLSNVKVADYWGQIKLTVKLCGLYRICARPDVQAAPIAPVLLISPSARSRLGFSEP